MESFLEYSSRKGFEDSLTNLNPSSVRKAAKRMGVEDGWKEFAKNLASSPEVKSVVNLIKDSPRQDESFVSDVMNTIVKEAYDLVAGVLRPLLPGGGGSLDYTVWLMLTFLLAPTLAILGAPTATGVVAWTGLWWFLRWFGVKFILPAVKWAEGL